MPRHRLAAAVLLAALLTPAPLSASPAEPTASPRSPAVPEAPRTVVRQYGDGPVRLRDGSPVAIRFRGRDGDRVAPFAELYPLSAYSDRCSRYTVRRVGGRPLPADEFGFHRLRRRGWHVIAYTPCRGDARPERLQLTRLRVRPLVVDGPAQPHRGDRGFLTAFRVHQEAGQRVYVQTEAPTPTWSPPVFFDGDHPGIRPTPETRTYTYIESLTTGEPRVESALVRARTILELPPMQAGEPPRTWTVTDPGRWMTARVEAGAAPHYLVASGSTMAADVWQASLTSEHPIACGKGSPNGCGDGSYTFANTPFPVTYDGPLRILLTVGPGAAGSVDLAVGPCPSTGCTSPRTGSGGSDARRTH
ncbi:hypothetical protein DDE18_01535 [Nocardioides gansuensis]|uniref:Uncharacterized protein n=1 Tax=Nocardioides gansuensis TaxID=2138300 RepID=A0A2T8FF46_9ACTN|nr:hypothetical protein [Nocardioides gansuensis]PVG84333.1 hypothetical protein DDE18_01535 [Nocardioides gansuensis]